MRLLPFLIVALLPLPGLAQTTDPAQRAPGAAITGLVHDSLARRPLAAATVQLVDADSMGRPGRSTLSDSLGRFRFDGVPAGRYTIGFFHPMLDSLGLDWPLRELYVLDHRTVRADLAIPSAARFRAAVCGQERSPRDTGAVVVGIVRDAGARTPLAAVTVAGEWLEISFRADGLLRRVPRVTATTGETGWFAICGVPRGGTMALSAARGADSTDRISVEVPTDGFLRRDLYLGAAEATDGANTPQAIDTFAPPPVRLRRGNGRLAGRVVTAEGGRPLAGARVQIAEGPQAVSNERGEWVLVNAPSGTRMLEVRAVGYYPEIRPVDVISDAATVQTSLSTLKAMLDTVRVTATRVRMQGTGFDERRRSGMGRYLTPADIERWRPHYVSDLFQLVSGVRMYRTDTSTTVLVRGTAAGWCSPAIYLNGNYMMGLTAADMDGWLNPREITGIEIYSGGTVPPQYQQGMTACGSIVYWAR